MSRPQRTAVAGRRALTGRTHHRAATSVAGFCSRHWNFTPPLPLSPNLGGDGKDSLFRKSDWPGAVWSEGTKLQKSKDRAESAKVPKERARAEARNRQITAKEADDVEEMSSPRTPVIYEIVRKLGDEEMDRPITSLWWSGVAAGLSISFSLLAQGILQAHLPERSWRPLVSNLGYPVRFLMSVL